jgi:hypothetical protein
MYRYQDYYLMDYDDYVDLLMLDDEPKKDPLDEAYAQYDYDFCHSLTRSQY